MSYFFLLYNFYQTFRIIRYLGIKLRISTQDSFNKRLKSFFFNMTILVDFRQKIQFSYSVRSRSRSVQMNASSRSFSSERRSISWTIFDFEFETVFPKSFRIFD